MPKRPPVQTATIWLTGWAATCAGLGLLTWGLGWKVGAAAVLVKAGSLLVEDAGLR